MRLLSDTICPSRLVMLNEKGSIHSISVEQMETENGRPVEAGIPDGKVATNGNRGAQPY
jgi:hypothetical protein